MITILFNSPFGFVFEISGDTCYNSVKPYEIFLNGRYVRHDDRNVSSLFELKPDTDYHIELCGLDITFDIRTKPCGYLLNVREYNAQGDGVSNDTAAIAAAIYAAPEGGTVYIPAGDYLVSHIFLKSGVDIYLERGAVIRQTTERKHLAVLKGFQNDYRHEDATINSSWEGNPLDCYASLIYGKSVSGVNIYGQGLLDGSGAESGFWNQPKIKDVAFRPRNISLFDCRDITVAGIKSGNSACWNIHPHRCENLRFLELHIENPADSPNTDGLNPESCNGVAVIGCRFTVGDDCIAIKSGKPFMARTRYRPCENVRIRNCLMEKGHGAVVIGSEAACGVYNVNISQCRFVETDRGFLIKTRRGRGEKSVVDNIRFENVIMERVKHCFVVNMFYHCDPDGHSLYVSDKNPRPKGADTPSIRSINLSKVRCMEITGSGVFIYGLPESPVTGVKLEDCEFEFAKERVIECPAMMDGFEVSEPIDFFYRNAEV